jgi:hypothetical protein
MRNLKVYEHLWDHSDNMAAGSERGLSHGAHQANLRATVDESDPSRRKLPAKSFRGAAIEGVGAVCGSAEYGDIANLGGCKHLAFDYLAGRSPAV